MTFETKLPTKKASSIAATVFAFLAVSAPVHAATIDDLSIIFKSGAEFTGEVTFADDYRSITAINGTLTDYSANTFGMQYVGPGFKPVSDVINQITDPTYQDPQEPSLYVSMVGDHGKFVYQASGTVPGYFTETNNQLLLEYSLVNNAPVLEYAFIDSPYDSPTYTPTVSGNISAVPLPPSLALFSVGLVGLMGFSWRRKNPETF